MTKKMFTNGLNHDNKNEKHNTFSVLYNDIQIQNMITN